MFASKFKTKKKIFCSYCHYNSRPTRMQIFLFV